ncbi:hypothetical protein HHK36_014874 [Tetracentron sinense]|uniref:SPARK domain-containing protein n=1 Tax=Tetracentron sinense TaxID=13715 RepID=A0A834Z9Z6_TETSI|nr:hypothetical protein HHK36_014874 [Tetracentron sinense]
MSQNPTRHSVIFVLFFILPVVPGLPAPDPATIQPFFPTPSPPATIPAFPEQSDLADCQLDLPDELFHGISNACARKGSNGRERLPRRSRCCPVLAAWLYSAYSGTALSMAGRMTDEPYDLPVLPGDSETCVDNLEKALKGRGMELAGPNETCDMVYCYCGIRLHPLSCPEAFTASNEGKLVGDVSVKRLERDCLSSKKKNNGYEGLGRCSKCLNRLYQLNKEKSGNSSKSDRTSKMHNRDCELMGLTWLLAKNRTAYIPTVSAVFRALMMSPDSSDPQSCSLSSDGMPLAVDSAELDNASSSHAIQSPFHLTILSLSLVYVCVILSSVLF